jgi:multidrug efflux pump subunit AcrA (membrane-fusion protein)
MPDRRAYIQQITTWILVAVATVAMVLFLVPSVRDAIFGWFRAPENRQDAPAKGPPPLVLLKDADGHHGLRISKAAMDSYQVDPVEVVRAEKSRPMPPQIGTVNFDNDYLYTIRPRFAGEMFSFKQIAEPPLYPGGPIRKRDISFGDKVKQGEVLGVFWSKDLGLAKAALVDAIVSKSLSEENYRRYQELAGKGAVSQATLLAAEKQLRSDINTYNSALRPLYVWKLPKEEIGAVSKEAADILKDVTKPRDPEEEIKRWARVEIRAPIFARDENGKPDPSRELIILEKNTTANDFVDPGRDTPLFKLADLTRLQIWVHPPEEYLPMLQKHLDPKRPATERNGDELRLLARFQADPPGTPPLPLTISRIAPSLDPTLKTPMLIAELKNPDRKYLVGQYVNALIELPALKDTVEVPTDAVNLVESQSLVLVRPKDGKNNEYFLRRVAVAQAAGKMTLIRSKLTPEDEKLSADEVAKNRRPIEPLKEGEVVLTRGVVELTSALEELVANPNRKE